MISEQVARRPSVWLPHLKAACHQLRKFAVTGRGNVHNVLVPKPLFHKVTREKAFQLSLIARALPPPNKKVCERTEKEFFNTCLIPHKTKFESSNRFEALATYLIDHSDYIPRGKFNIPEDAGLPGCSSSFHSTRRQGGQASEFAWSIDAVTQKKLKAPMTTREKRFIRPSLIKTALNKFAKAEPNCMRVVPLPERGYKCRVVTCSNARTVSEAHRERRRLWRIILRTPQISRHLGAPAKSIRLDTFGHLISADLTKATDGLSHQALSWFCLKFNLDPRLIYRGFTVDDEGSILDYLRGAPMGMPATWAILSLCHWMIIRETGAKRFAIRGDDAVFRMTSKQYKSYLRNLDNFGFEINAKKTFFSSDMVTFCERMYQLKGDSVHLLPHLGLRFTNPEKQVEVIRDLHLMTAESGLPVHVVHRAMEIGGSWLFALAKQCKVPKYLPSFYGGMGLPPKSAESRCSRRHEAKIRYADTHGLSMPSSCKVTGTEIEKVMKLLSSLVGSVSVTDPCPHAEEMSTSLIMPAMIEDMINESLKEVSPSPYKYLKRLSARFDSIPCAWNGLSAKALKRKGKSAAPPKGRRILDLWTRDVKVSRASTRKVFGHPIGYTCTNEAVKRSPYYSFFMLNF